MSRRSGLTVGSLRGVPMGGASMGAVPAGTVSMGRAPASGPGPAPGGPAAVRPRVALPLAPGRRRGCCGTGCVGCPYGDWIRRVRALGAGPGPSA